MKQTYKRVPRKIKNGLKKEVIKGTGFKSQECRIRGIRRGGHLRFESCQFKFKTYAVQAYELG